MKIIKIEYFKIIAILLFICSRYTYAQKSVQHNHAEMIEGNKAVEEHSGHKMPYTPAGLMLPHLGCHSSGSANSAQSCSSWMVEYMYMGMAMNSLLTGRSVKDPYGVLYLPNTSYQVGLASGHNHGAATQAIDPFPNFTSQTLNTTQYRYMSAPVSMIMEMHMLSLMKSITEKISLSLLLPYATNKMEMLSSDLEKTTMGTKSVGDITVLMDWQLLHKESHTVFVRLGESLPTGSIGEKRFMPMMGNVKVPYNMQLGAGSYSTILGLGYYFDLTRFSMGLFAQGIFRGSANHSGYKLGNRYESSAWVSYAALKWILPSVRISYSLWENVQGGDAEIYPLMDPQNDPLHQGGRRADILPGIMIQLGENIRLFLEGGKPFYQHLNGPMLGTDGIFNLKVQAMF